MNEDTVGGSVPAFPVAIEKENSNGVKWTEHEFGLTKREIFAAMAMQGAMHALAIHAEEFDEDTAVDPYPIARDAARMADALLKELAK
jgi:hypothetical protein